MINFFQTGNESECCGCTACANVCPKHCIELKRNHEGFLYPHKDIDKCINCGLCEKVCPFSDNYTFETVSSPSVFAAYDKDHRKGSSSGGLFYTIAKHVIEDMHGWVFGAAFDDEFQLRHIGVNNLEELQKLRGSKYLQSSMGDTYSMIKKLLANNSFVFFVGTPCQVAGLRGYLRNKKYDNLLLADLVCHGVPPQSLFDEHIKYLEKKHKAKLVSYQFRKLDGWGGCEIADFTNPKKHKVLPSYNLSPYLYSFMYSMTYRESCYECKFAKVPRQGDITLADFWGVKKFFPNTDSSKGVSLVLINTDMGSKIWTSISSKCISFESSLEECTIYNGNINHKPIRPEIRNIVYSELKEYGYEYLVNNHFTIDNYRTLRIKNSLAEYPIIKKILEWKNK